MRTLTWATSCCPPRDDSACWISARSAASTPGCVLLCSGLLLALDRGDPAGLADALLDLVERPEDLDELRLERTLGRFAARHVAAGVTPDVRMFADLFRIVAEYGLAAAGIRAVMMIGLHGGPNVTKTVSLYTFFGYCLLVTAAIPAVRVAGPRVPPGHRLMSR